jgi:recombinational DNA repair ATPase RecF
VLVCALQLAAQRLWGRAGLACVWLVDDLAAELDPDRLARVWQGLRETDLQIFATSLTDPMMPGQVFHVEQGRITAANLQPTDPGSGYNP